jgi:hypothetical protein
VRRAHRLAQRFGGLHRPRQVGAVKRREGETLSGEASAYRFGLPTPARRDGRRAVPCKRPGGVALGFAVTHQQQIETHEA